ncbi:ring-cleaving dioxygenase [Cytobacillus gottheilii]|uniref:Ring-cleaving dioxygenase n=1 Tax=Cytobacillus gottheilii TaxID=859144 RepID=A0ABX8F9R0_9BACI|nr:ring-cleaving dioxygenase [Cytobacillus gottheilii]QVY61161.1 ring-cleaving dioxygenase [Cytobacillus gottheilii]
MKKATAGIHHITAIVGHPQENVDFYHGVLGLRLVKKTINFDDPGTYHLYFGDQNGNPGTIITFFPWANAYPGKIGDGQVGVTSYAVPAEALPFWEERFARLGISFEKTERFGEEIIAFTDPHGLKLELVERASGELNQWGESGVPADKAIKGFAGAIFFSAYPLKTAEVLEEVMGLEKVAENDEYIRFQSSAEIGNIVDVKKVSTGKGRMGVGMVHHIAWRAQDDEDQLDWKQYIENKGLGVTPVQDRNYFNAIYFREYGEILFEIATDPPGFAHDESLETMGTELKLPEQYEQYRSKLEQSLIPIEVRDLNQ